MPLRDTYNKSKLYEKNDSKEKYKKSDLSDLINICLNTLLDEQVADEDREKFEKYKSALLDNNVSYYSKQ